MPIPNHELGEKDWVIGLLHRHVPDAYAETPI